MPSSSRFVHAARLPMFVGCFLYRLPRRLVPPMLNSSRGCSYRLCRLGRVDGGGLSAGSAAHQMTSAAAAGMAAAAISRSLARSLGQHWPASLGCKKKHSALPAFLARLLGAGLPLDAGVALARLRSACSCIFSACRVHHKEMILIIDKIVRLLGLPRS